MTDTVPDCEVLERARSRDARYPWVLLAELADGSGGFARGYVVWYEDERQRRSQGHYTSSPEDARAEFERRAGLSASVDGARPRAALAGDRALRWEPLRLRPRPRHRWLRSARVAD